MRGTCITGCPIELWVELQYKHIREPISFIRKIQNKGGKEKMGLFGAKKPEAAAEIDREYEAGMKKHKEEKEGMRREIDSLKKNFEKYT